MTRGEVSGAALAAALGYAAAWRGRTVVVKVGGSVLDGEPEAGHGAGAAAETAGEPAPGLHAGAAAGTRGRHGTAAEDLALLHRAGIRTVVVHGGGPEVSRLLARLDLPARFEQGLRVTDGPTMQVAEMVLSGDVNKRLAARLAAAGAPAVGISGRDGGLLLVRPHPDAERLGFVGEADRVEPALLRTLLDAGYLPVVSPVGADASGRPYNVNADAAAAAVAVGLGAEKLILLTDVAGIFAGDPGAPELVSELDAAETRRLVAEGTISRGMVPKVKACLAAVGAGVPSAHIVGAGKSHALLIELFTEEGIGTMIRAEAPGEGAYEPAGAGRRARRSGAYPPLDAAAGQ